MSAFGVWIVGAGGHVGACTVAGWHALASQLVPPTGLVTAAHPLDALPLAPLADVVFGGHELPGKKVADAVQRLGSEGILGRDVIAAAAVKDGIAALEREVRAGVVELGGWDDYQRVRADLAGFRSRHAVERVVVLNVASTEAGAPSVATLPAEPEALFAALRGGARIPASVVYALAAIELGLGYINFTPSPGSDVPALHALADERGAVHVGADGKTGQTLLKTVLAPMFAIRRLRVTSWVSHNVLGNEDGRALDDPARRAAKQRSKRAPLAAILGYEPESQVGIDYVPSYGDWKVAWDRIVFQGFGGAEMSLEMTWRGSDTALAAPLCIDLVRLVELAQRRGERGVLAHLALFFKNPIGTSEHRLDRQWQQLIAHLLPGSEVP